MAVFKCKMCGGTIEFENGATVGECDSCGTKQTLPKLDDERRINLYDRANHFRRNNEFDKAMGIYEQILNEDTTDAEAYWSLVLCRYGIEYVEDPATHKRVPTVNRAQFTSIFDDDNYKSAIQYADTYQKSIYEEEANTINEIQKGILAISQKEEPFDVFICYKETDTNGRRTPDSVLANDLYHQLVQEGFKVFFSRITLEDKLGTAYEPYIFAALNSAKVMVVLGTKPEYFNAVWVKNEWSRFLALVKVSGGKKTLIPAYKDIDPYNLPDEFSHLQAQDMSKLGFMQDLIRGIKKIVGSDTKKQEAQQTIIMESVGTGNSANIDALLKRAFLSLEDGDWSKADEFCEQVLNYAPENPQAYLGKLMSELHVKNVDSLKNCNKPFSENKNFGKILKFGDEGLISSLNNYNNEIFQRNEIKRKQDIYNQAQKNKKLGLENYSENEILEAIRLFKSVSDWKDSNEQVTICDDAVKSIREYCKQKQLFDNACNLMNHARQKSSINELEQAKEYFKGINLINEAADYVEQCEEIIQELRKKDELKQQKKIIRKRKRKKTIKVIGIVLVIMAIIAGTIIFILGLEPSESKIKSLALKYADLDSSFEVEDIEMNKVDSWNDSWSKGFIENVYIKAINKDSKDILNVNLKLKFYKDSLRYKDSYNREETVFSILPNHVPDENDYFPLPDINLNYIDSDNYNTYEDYYDYDEDEDYSEDDEYKDYENESVNEDIKKIINIDYPNIVIEGNMALVPINIAVDGLNSKGEVAEKLTYYYEENNTWSGYNSVKIEMYRENDVPLSSIQENVSNCQFFYNNGFENEKLDSESIYLENYTIRYYNNDLRAEVNGEFSWENENVKIQGSLIENYIYDGSWKFVSCTVNENSLITYWKCSIDDSDFLHELPEIIEKHCDETNNVSGIELTNTISYGSKLKFNAQYYSTNDIYLLLNKIEVRYYATVLSGYVLREVEETDTSYEGLSEVIDKDINVKYNIEHKNGKPNNTNLDGSSKLHLHIDKNGSTKLTGKIGAVSINYKGKIEYPKGTIKIDSFETELNVHYKNIAFGYFDGDLKYLITPYLKYKKNILSGYISCKCKDPWARQEDNDFYINFE
ncbi:MAG: TIR domain-containing protein [Lachnospiraceae bacterium]|nr:TIR domain-containing protein [Lachnospiraceae bacterium]